MTHNALTVWQSLAIIEAQDNKPPRLNWKEYDCNRDWAGSILGG